MPDPWAFGWDQIAAFLNITVIGFAAWVAWRGVRDWREERLDARQSEVAEQALILAYQAREVFDRIRSPGGFAGEGSSRRAEAEETPEEKEARDSALYLSNASKRKLGFSSKWSKLGPASTPYSEKDKRNLSMSSSEYDWRSVVQRIS